MFFRSGCFRCCSWCAGARCVFMSAPCRGKRSQSVARMAPALASACLSYDTACVSPAQFCSSTAPIPTSATQTASLPWTWLTCPLKLFSPVSASTSSSPYSVFLSSVLLSLIVWYYVCTVLHLYLHVRCVCVKWDCCCPWALLCLCAPSVVGMGDYIEYPGFIRDDFKIKVRCEDLNALCG